MSQARLIVILAIGYMASFTPHWFQKVTVGSMIALAIYAKIKSWIENRRFKRECFDRRMKTARALFDFSEGKLSMLQLCEAIHFTQADVVEWHSNGNFSRYIREWIENGRP